LKEGSIFLNESSLFLNYLPPKLLYRDHEYNFLKSIFKEFDFYSQSALIVGGIGFGKTTLSNFFGLNISKKSSSIKYISIPCLECRNSFYKLLLKLIKNFIPDFPSKGFSLSELIKRLTSLLKSLRINLIILIDDLEFLINEDQIYNLARFKEALLDEKMKIDFIYTLGSEDYLDELDKEYVGFIKKNIVKLKKYSKEEIEKILAYRASLAFKKDKVKPEAIELIAQLASETGNLAYAIEVLWKAGKYAENENAKQLANEHILKVYNELTPKIRNDLNNFLTFHEKLFLKAILELFKKFNLNFISIGEAKKVYEDICKKYNEKPRKHTQLWEYMHDLNKLGLISLKTSGKGFKGKSTLISFQPKTISTIERLVNI